MRKLTTDELSKVTGAGGVYFGSSGNHRNDSNANIMGTSVGGANVSPIRYLGSHRYSYIVNVRGDR